MESPIYKRTKEIRYDDLGKGKIITYTKSFEDIHEDGPILFAIIKLDVYSSKFKTDKVFAQLTDFDIQPQIGQAVECVTRRFKETISGLITYSYKFRPVLLEEVSTSSK